MKKVLFLDYSPIFAGAERMLYNVLTHIDRDKYEPILAFPYPQDHQSRYSEVDCEKICLADSLKWWMGSDRWTHPLRGTDFLKRAIFGQRIANLINRKQIDILDVNLMRNDVMMWVWATRRFTTAKIVGHYRSQEQEFVAPWYAQKLFDVIACVSEFSRMRFRIKGDFTKTVVLYDSVDIDVMKCDISQSNAKKKVGYDDCILLVSVGQLSARKGHDNAIRAFAKILPKYPTAKLLIAGGGGGDTPKDYYQKIASDLGVSDKVSIPGSQIDNIQEVYRAADLTLSLTKVGEGFGLVPYESALIGTPFIAPCFGAVREFVKDGVNGLLVDTNDIDAIASKISYALEHKEDSVRMTASLRSLIKERLSPSTLAHNLDALYTSLYIPSSHTFAT
jgi:glycosyltransferase involved in cell wall biosynthesis